MRQNGKIFQKTLAKIIIIYYNFKSEKCKKFTNFEKWGEKL